MTTVKEAATRLVAQVGGVVVGKRAATEQLLAALLVDGHVLLDDVPGVGKTTLARGSPGRSRSRSSHPGTPDLGAVGHHGFSLFDHRTHTFEYRPVRSWRHRSGHRSPRHAGADSSSVSMQASVHRRRATPRCRSLSRHSDSEPIDSKARYPCPSAADLFLYAQLCIRSADRRLHPPRARAVTWSPTPRADIDASARLAARRGPRGAWSDPLSRYVAMLWRDAQRRRRRLAEPRAALALFACAGASASPSRVLCLTTEGQATPSCGTGVPHRGAQMRFAHRGGRRADVLALTPAAENGARGGFRCPSGRSSGRSSRDRRRRRISRSPSIIVLASAASSSGWSCR